MGIKYGVNEMFFDHWNPIMAYTLGFWFADGSLEDASYIRGKYIRVTSTDKEIIKSIKKWLASDHKIIVVFPHYPNHKIRYMLRIGSHKLYDSLQNHGLYPNKSLTIRFPKIPREFLMDFVRGYFDGDGCVYLERSKGKRQDSIIKRLVVIFTSGSREFLEGLKNVLNEELCAERGGLYKSRRSFQLRYGTSDSVKLFKLFYTNTNQKLYFQRKFKIFQKYFVLRPERVDEEIEQVFRKR